MDWNPPPGITFKFVTQGMPLRPLEASRRAIFVVLAQTLRAADTFIRLPGDTVIWTKLKLTSIWRSVSGSIGYRYCSRGTFAHSEFGKWLDSSEFLSGTMLIKCLESDGRREPSPASGRGA